MKAKLEMRNEELGILKQNPFKPLQLIPGILILGLLLTGCSGGKKGWGGSGGGFKPVVVVRDDLQITVLATGTS